MALAVPRTIRESPDPTGDAAGNPRGWAGQGAAHTEPLWAGSRRCKSQFQDAPGVPRLLRHIPVQGRAHPPLPLGCGTPGDKPAYKPRDKPGYKPGYKLGYKPGYKPGDPSLPRCQGRPVGEQTQFQLFVLQRIQMCPSAPRAGYLGWFCPSPGPECCVMSLWWGAQGLCRGGAGAME